MDREAWAVWPASSGKTHPGCERKPVSLATPGQRPDSGAQERVGASGQGWRSHRAATPQAPWTRRGQPPRRSTGGRVGDGSGTVVSPGEGASSRTPRPGDAEPHLCVTRRPWTLSDSTDLAVVAVLRCCTGHLLRSPFQLVRGGRMPSLLSTRGAGRRSDRLALLRAIRRPDTRSLADIARAWCGGD